MLLLSLSCMTSWNNPSYSIYITGASSALWIVDCFHVKSSFTNYLCFSTSKRPLSFSILCDSIISNLSVCNYLKRRLID
jgi:hypothetical protein